MYCPYCGKYNKEEAKFCSRCGARLEEDNTFGGQGTVDMGFPAPGKKKRKKIWLVPAAALVLAAAAAAAVFLWVLPGQKEKNYEAHISDGQRYLEEMDYERAEDSYLAAIEIEPKEAEPYLRLADIYAARHETEKAADILKQGVENAGSSEIRERYDLYTYVNEVLIPKEGQCEEGEYVCRYINQARADSGWTGLEPVHSEKGILTSRIRDFDLDGKEELLVLSLNNDARKYEYTRVDQNEVILRMYESVDGEVALSDEMSALCPVLGSGDSESSGIFLHENEGRIYICGSLRQHMYMYADGITFDSFVLTYEGDRFVKHAGTDEAVSGSEFSGEMENAENMAAFLEEIGLANEAEQIRESWISCFEFVDDVEMLMLIEGENNSSSNSLIYWETNDPDDLGEVVLTLRLSWDEEKDGNESFRAEEAPEDDTDMQQLAESAEETYADMLNQEEYISDISDWMEPPESYSILDIDQDQIPELMVHSANDGFGWSNTLLYVYDVSSGQVTLAEDIYHYADIRYSGKYKAIVYSDVRSTQMYGGQGFFTLDGTTLNQAFSVGWDNTSGRENYFVYENDLRTDITQAESDAYYDELTDIEKTEL